MEVKLIHSPINRYPLQGILVRGTTVSHWLQEIQILGLNLSELQVFAIPDNSPNTIWGCAIFFNTPQQKINPGHHECCQCISPNLYIAERSDIFPSLHPTEIEKLFSTGKHLFHPHFGCVELLTEIDFTTVIAPPVLKNISVTKPASSTPLPSSIRSFQVQPQAPEDILSKLNTEIFPKRERMKDDRLDILEKIKLQFYRLFYTKHQLKDKSVTTPTGFGSWLQSLFNTNIRWGNVQQDFEELERRNQEQLDKLLDLLKKDPKEGLKYAIPIDPGTGRGTTSDSIPFFLSKRWFDFSLFSNSPSGYGGTLVTPDDHLARLRQQYLATATELIRRGEHKEAAFVYMKLLKDFHKAAETMEAGHHYQEAATIHIKHTGNEIKAAQCYEKGNMLSNAISIYVKRNEDEKAGDLYMLLNDKASALHHYEKVIERYKRSNQHIKASQLYRDKMDDTASAQSVLMEGWRNRRDAVNCLNAYFSNIVDDRDLHQAIQHVYNNDTDQDNKSLFLSVMKYQYQRKQTLQEPLREIAYEVIADLLPYSPDVVNELRSFNPGNKDLMKDMLRFKTRGSLR